MTGTPIVHAHSSDEVASAFGPQGSHNNTPYILGLVVPPNFDESLRAGSHPQLILYINASAWSVSDQQLLEHALSDYARSVTSPQPPISFALTTINLPTTSNFVQDYTQRYAMAGLLYSLTIGISFVPGLLVEEKEKKTLRMLMVSPASWGDVVLGKLLVALVYQLLVSAVVLAILGGFSGQIPALLFFVLLSSCFGLVLGLLFVVPFVKPNNENLARGVTYVYAAWAVIEIGRMIIGQRKPKAFSLFAHVWKTHIRATA